MMKSKASGNASFAYITPARKLRTNNLEIIIWDFWVLETVFFIFDRIFDMLDLDKDSEVK